ncbi:hypothetical protein E2562_013875 [Oryza meyeriana var. granulata]|uniref:Uncharacterized protein n=1 Tax=Oryza meyeriana var. granulata TaxID=110450 RepID=A0A6G1C5V9_9ORYZ|nr:hypothetical protein E2562_013875 [Oryza meyeriana var. granulata]
MNAHEISVQVRTWNVQTWNQRPASGAVATPHYEQKQTRKRRKREQSVERASIVLGGIVHPPAQPSSTRRRALPIRSAPLLFKLREGAGRASAAAVLLLHA